MGELVLAVVSDVHASDRVDQHTHVSTSPGAAASTLHPLVDLAAHIYETHLRADYLLIPGDLANQAHQPGLAYAWQQANHLAGLLGAELLGVPGNHDLTTHNPSIDSRAGLKSLVPSFPTGDPGRDSTFWKSGWVALEESQHRILLLDSTFDFPPYPTNPTDPLVWTEYTDALNRGGFTEQQEAQIDDYLRTATRKLNIAVIHHHPLEHQLRHQFQDSYGPMRRGGELIDLLSRHPRAGRWLIVHGHKHVPQIASAVAVSSNGPIMLCAGSLGAHIWPPLNTVARNQFHLVKVRDDNPSGLGFLLGQIQSAMWCLGEGWLSPPPRGGGLPRLTGFGCVVDHRTLAQRCKEEMDLVGVDFLPLPRLVAAIPELPYIAPRDFEHLETEIEALNLEFTRGRDEEVKLLARKVAS